jgi:PAS domain S-box-containing protein
MKRKLKILHLEDNPHDALLTKETLESEGILSEITMVETEKDFVEAIKQGRFDLILADYSLPGFDGLRALDLALTISPRTPFIFVTGNQGDDVAVEAYRKGATDFVLKDRLFRLAAVVKRALKEKKEEVEKQRALEALQQSEEKYRNFIEYAPIGMLTTTSEWTLTYANRKMEEITGYKRSDWYQKSLLPLIYPDDQPVILEKVQKRLAGQGTSDPYEIRFIHASGKVIWVRITPESIYAKDDNGQKNLVGMQAFIEDITDRKSAEQALLASENTLQSILSSAPTGIGVSRTRVIEQVNDHLLEMVGYSREELLGKKARVLYSNESEYQSVGKAFDSQINQKGVGTVETRWQRKDGGIIQVLIQSAPIDAHDLSKGITFTVLDITDRKKTEESLRRSEERQNRLIQQSFDIIYETDEFGFFKNLSPQTEQVFGFKPEELIGRHFQEIVKESYKERVMGQFQKALAGENFGFIEFNGKKANGSDAYLELKYIVERDEDNLIGTFGVIRDLTEHHRMQNQLQQSQKMEAIGTLAGGIAHDFNNILGAIMGYTQLALGDLPDESPLKYNFEQVLKASNRAKDLIKQILTFSRQGDQENRPIHIIPVINEALKLLRASVPKSIEIKKKLMIQEDMINGDPIRIHQVMMNLGANAAQAMPDQKGAIEVLLDESELSAEDITGFPEIKPGPYIRLSVSDTGMGIDPKDQMRIFDPFFTTKKPGEGTGMGLSVVHGIVKDLGGLIKVYSVPGEGTSFKIYLPQIRRTLDVEAKTKMAIPTGSERLLFIDDEPDLVNTWVQMLERLGYTVSSRGSSRDALELFRLRADQFDLVITDQTMPHMNGLELSREFLAIRPNIPIILCSGFSEMISTEEIKNIGIKEFLMKPILLGEIAQTIRKVLERKNG